MNRRVSVDRERGRVSFALYAYPFEATHIAPAQGGENVERVIVEGPSVTIVQREHPSEWNLLLYWLQHRSDSQYVDIRSDEINVPHRQFDEDDAERILDDADTVIDYVTEHLP